MDDRESKYYQFLRNMSDDHQLTEDELKTVAELRSFFLKLYAAGEEEESRQLIDVEDFPPGYSPNYI